MRKAWKYCAPEDIKGKKNLEVDIKTVRFLRVEFYIARFDFFFFLYVEIKGN